MKLAHWTTIISLLTVILLNGSKTAAQQFPTPSIAKPISGCLFGDGDGSYRGDRPLTRNEFAAGMNACLDRVNQVIPNKADLAIRADFERLIQRQRQLNEQLKGLSDRVDALSNEPPSR